MDLNKRLYTPEFKSQLIKEVEDTGNLSSVAKAHDVPVQTLHSWVGKTKRRDEILETKAHAGLKKKLADAELEILVLGELLKKNKPSMAQRIEVVKEMVSSERTTSKLLRLAQVPHSSWYYDQRPKSDDRRTTNGRKPPGFTVNRDGAILLDVSSSNLLIQYRGQSFKMHAAILS